MLQVVQEEEDLYVSEDVLYSFENYLKCEEEFKHLKERGVIKAKSFSSDTWKFFDGYQNSTLFLNYSEPYYQENIRELLNVTYDEAGSMLRCYIISCASVFAVSSLLQRAYAITTFFNNYKAGKELKVSQMTAAFIVDFLYYIEIPAETVSKIKRSLKVHKVAGKQRELSPLINYLAIDDAIQNLYDSSLDDENFVYWFPIYFWVNITFIIPLRSKEMLLTPFDCLSERDGEKTIILRRTKLKRGTRVVHQDVNKDYQLFEYPVPDNAVIQNIKKYQELTKDLSRPYLFSPSKRSTYNYFLPAVMARRLKEFVQQYLIGNHKYDFAKYAAGVNEFEIVTPGDSRPLAMSMLYFQNISADLCRQLANHRSIDTSAWYYSNIDETIMGSAILRMQKMINAGIVADGKIYERAKSTSIATGNGSCMSDKRRIDPTDITDCIQQNQLERCIGCKYYVASETELQDFLNERKNKVQEASTHMVKIIDTVEHGFHTDFSIADELTKVQTEIRIYQEGCVEKLKGDYITWQKHKNSAKNS